MGNPPHLLALHASGSLRSDREQDRLEKRAEDRDRQDLRTLERAQNILESAINRLAVLPAIEWPNRRWTIGFPEI